MKNIDQLRLEIDQIHLQLNQLLLQRLHLAEEIWTIKKSQDQNLTDSAREQKMIDLFLKIETSDLEKEFLKNIHTAILQNSKNCLMQKMKAIYDNK